MSNTNAATKTEKSVGGIFALVVIPVIFLASVLAYMYIFGNSANFEGGDNNNHPISEGAGKWLGVIYKGGPVVPVLLSCFLMVFAFTIERMLTIGRSKGTGNVASFVKSIRKSLSSNDISGAITSCDKQKGSVAAVIKEGLVKYQEMEKNTELDKESKIAAIQKNIEEATQLEMPMLQKNLVIISTLASVSTLIGLLGTVIGMIKAFAALANAGAPDATQLANGISEALINTALGIGSSTFAIIFYNYFTNKIDSLTYGIDEAGYSVVNTFSATHKG